MTNAEFHRARRARKFHSFILFFASCIWAVGGFAASIELQGQNKGDTNTWTMNNLMGWQELDKIACRVYFKNGSVNNQSITIFFPHLRGTTPGFQNLYDFTPSPNAVITSGPTLTTDASGTWSYRFIVSITNNNPGYVQFQARLAAGAHLNAGSSLQLDGDPQSMGQLQIHKPGPGPALPDLAIVKTGPLTIPQGEMITYMLAYTNKDGAITNTGMGVQICDILPPDLIVNPSSLPSGGELVGNTIFFDLTNIASHASGQITFQALVPFTTPVGRVLTNFSQILCSQDDADFSDNTSTWLTTVTNGCVMPAVTGNPGDAMKCPGDSVTFSVGASGTAPLYYQWRKNGGVISGATDISYTINPVAAGDSGTYDVVVTNACGTATSSGAVLNANDTTPPTISCPANVIVAANASCVATNVSLGTPVTGDNCSVVAVTNNAPTIFPLGTNVVTWTVVDASGNMNSCAQQVIVRDQTVPTITCSSNLVLSADAGQCSRNNVTFIVAASDNCSVANLTSVPASGSTFPIGTTTVTNIATDASGNTATCTFTVTVVAETIVTTPPTNQIVCVGGTASFNVVAAGASLIYQWVKGTNLLSGATNSTLTLLNVTTNYAAEYCVVVSGACGSPVTNCATLTLLTNVSGIGPVNRTNCIGTTAVFSIFANGTGPFTYQWRKNGVAIPGATFSRFGTNVVSLASAGTYSVVVGGACGSLTNSATLTVRTPVSAVGPTNQTLCPDGQIVLNTVASGTGPFFYQWRVNGQTLQGATSSTLSISTTESGTRTYSVIVGGPCKDLVTNSATLTVLTNTGAGNVINLTNVCPGVTVEFSIAATGTGPFTYQWLRRIPTGGVIQIPGATNSTFVLTNVSSTNSGLYSVSVTGACGSVVRFASLNVGALLTDGHIASRTNCPGTTVTFGGPEGVGLNYRWFKDGSGLVISTNRFLMLTNISANDAGTYTLVATGPCNSVTNSATLTLNQPIVILSAPTNRTNCPGTTAAFSVAATGTGLIYQWFKNGTVLTNQTGSTLTLTNVTANDAATYCVRVNGTCDHAVTNCATLTVNSNTVVLTPPADKIVCEGGTANFSVAASGASLTYQWSKGATVLTGETNSSLTISGVTTNDAGTYTVTVSGECGNSEARSASLAVSTLVTASAPGNLFQNPGTTATFSTTASGTGPLTYQWKKDGVAIIGETTNSLVLADITFDSAGTYTVVVSGPCNSVERSGTLTVNHPPTVSILTPTNNHVFNVGQNISIVANATDSDGSVTNVEIFVGTNTLAEISSLPYETTLTNPPPGMYELRARATDNLGLAATSAPVNISVIEQPQLIILTNIFLNRQSGYYEEIVRVFNPTAFASNTVGVLVFGVQSPIQVVNYTLLINGIPYVQNGNAIPPGGFADIKIKFYVPLNITNIPPPTLMAIVMPAVATASVSGTPVEITRAQALSDGSLLLNFKTVLGPTYFVEYSDDMVHWTTSPQTVAGTGFTAQWIDDGPPATGTFPPPSNTRFYRVSRVP